MLCTVYNDGSHYIAYQKVKSKYNFPKQKRFEDLTDMDKSFELYYSESVFQGLSIPEQKKLVREKIAGEFGDGGDILDNWIEEKFSVKLKNIELRKKRFKRKAFLNKWNYFVTFTYDDKKHSEESFKNKLRKSLSNFSSRRGWRVMGIWEYGAEEKRLHFHALLYVPDNEMVGEIVEKKEYSKKQHKMVVRHENTFFRKFGINDFAKLSEGSLSKGKTLDYILKYITKTNEKIVYSRCIKCEFECEVVEDDVVCEMSDFVIKYVLFDELYDYKCKRALGLIEYVEYNDVETVSLE